MMHTLILPIPPKLNEQINLARSHWAISANTKKEWTDKICAIALSQKIDLFPDKVWVEFTWFVTYANDQDNVCASSKYIFDGLVKAEILKNDNLTIIQSPIVHWFQKKKQSEEETVFLTISDKPFFKQKTEYNFS